MSDSNLQKSDRLLKALAGDGSRREENGQAVPNILSHPSDLTQVYPEQALTLTSLARPGQSCSPDYDTVLCLRKTIYGTVSA